VLRIFFERRRESNGSKLHSTPAVYRAAAENLNQNRRALDSHGHFYSKVTEQLQILFYRDEEDERDKAVSKPTAGFWF